MAVAHTHQPQVADVGEIVVNNEVVLVGFLLAGNVALTSLDAVAHDWTSILIILPHHVKRACVCLGLDSRLVRLDWWLEAVLHAEA